MNRQDAKDAKSAKRRDDLTAEDAEDAETRREGKKRDGSFALLGMTLVEVTLRCVSWARRGIRPIVWVAVARVRGLG